MSIKNKIEKVTDRKKHFTFKSAFRALAVEWLGPADSRVRWW